MRGSSGRVLWPKRDDGPQALGGLLWSRSDDDGLVPIYDAARQRTLSVRGPGARVGRVLDAQELFQGSSLHRVDLQQFPRSVVGSKDVCPIVDEEGGIREPFEQVPPGPCRLWGFVLAGGSHQI